MTARAQRSLVAAALAGVLALGVPATSVAQGSDGRPPRLEAGGFLGGLSIDQSLGSASNIYLSVTGQARNIDFGELAGFRASWAFTPNIAAEFQFSRGENAYVLSVDDDTLGAVDLGEQFSADQTFLAANAIVQFPLKYGFTPYGTAGVGRLQTELKSPISGLDGSLTTTDVNFGGGLKYFIPGVSWLGFRLDARYHTASDGLVSFPGGTDSPTGTEITIGAMIGLF